MIEVYRNVHLRGAGKNVRLCGWMLVGRVGSLVLTAVLRLRLSTENKLAAGVLGRVKWGLLFDNRVPPSPLPPQSLESWG